MLLKEILNAADKLYFHGLKLRKYLEADAFLRLERYAGATFCYELSALVMILLKDSLTATLCRGYYYGEDGQILCRHSWVELETAPGKHGIIDLAWASPEIIKKDNYLKNCAHGRLEQKWECPHGAFWQFGMAETIYKAMQKPKTSCILKELTAFGSPRDSFRTKTYCISSHQLQYGDGRYMEPYRHHHCGRMISTEIIQGFATPPR